MNAYELTLLYRIADATRPVRPFFAYLTHLGDGGIFFILFGCIFLLFPKTRKTGFYLLMTLLVGFVAGNLILKNIVHRMRPYVLDPSSKRRATTRSPRDIRSSPLRPIFSSIANDTRGSFSSSPSSSPSRAWPSWSTIPPISWAASSSAPSWASPWNARHAIRDKF